MDDMRDDFEDDLDDDLLSGEGSLLDDGSLEVGVVPDLDDDELDPSNPHKMPNGFGLEGGDEPE